MEKAKPCNSKFMFKVWLQLCRACSSVVDGETLAFGLPGQVQVRQLTIQFSQVPLVNTTVKANQIDAVTCRAKPQLPQPHRFRRRQCRDPFAVRHGAKDD